MSLRTSDVVPISEAHVRLTELAGLILLDEAEIGLKQILAGQRIAAADLAKALAD